MKELKKLALILRALGFSANIEVEKIDLKDYQIDNTNICVQFGKLCWSVWFCGDTWEVHLNNKYLYNEYWCKDILDVVFILIKDTKRYTTK